MTDAPIASSIAPVTIDVVSDVETSFTISLDSPEKMAADAASCSDLMSYLLFTPKYTRDLIELGYYDADDRIDEIEDYLFTDNGSKGSGSRSAKSRDVETRKRAPLPVR